MIGWGEVEDGIGLPDLLCQCTTTGEFFKVMAVMLGGFDEEFGMEPPCPLAVPSAHDKSKLLSVTISNYQ